MSSQAPASPWPMISSVSVVLLGSAAWLHYLYGMLDVRGRQEFVVELSKTLFSLVFVSLVAVLVKAVVDAYAAEREGRRQKAALAEVETRRAAEDEAARRASEHTRRLRALTTLTSAYWNAKKALKIIEAHRSAKTYGEQIRLVIDYRLELQQLRNEISAGMYALQHAGEIEASLGGIDHELGRVTDEWRDEYLSLSQQQKADEQLPPQAKQVPIMIERLSAFGAVRARDFAAISGPFDNALSLIRPQVFRDRGES